MRCGGSVGDGDGEALCDGVGAGVRPGGNGVPEGLGLGLGVPVGLGVGDGDAVGEGDAADGAALAGGFEPLGRGAGGDVASCVATAKR